MKPTLKNTNYFEVVEKVTERTISVKFANGDVGQLVLKGGYMTIDPSGIKQLDDHVIEVGKVYRAQLPILNARFPSSNLVLNLQYCGDDYKLKPVTPEPQLKVLDWNQLSELGLLERINREICHPLGLAVCRTPEDGNSEGALVSPDGSWEYDEDVPTLVKSDDEVKKLIELMSYVETVEK